jgi:uncharacterized protein YrrD
MLRNVKQIQGRALHARDGVIGEVHDVYFDDEFWLVRYLVVETGAWLSKRKVLIAPDALGAADLLDWEKKEVSVDLTVDQVRHSPSVDTDKPVSRQHEEMLRRHYGWPIYWNTVLGPGGLAAPLFAPVPAGSSSEPGFVDNDGPDEPRGDPHLRSTRDTAGYHIEAIDGSIGHVDDFLVDEQVWRIRYLLVDTRNWWPGRKVLISPDWINRVSWGDQRVCVDLTRAAVKNSPPYDPAAPWDAVYAATLHDYYGRPHYPDWEETIHAGSARSHRKHR